MKNTTSDEAFLHQYFHYYLRNMYGQLRFRDLKYCFMDGFEAPLDPMYLCDAIYELADRLGYALKDGMWVDK